MTARIIQDLSWTHPDSPGRPGTASTAALAAVATALLAGAASGQTFGTDQIVAPDVSPTAVEAADIDGDGDLDALVAGGFNIVWLENLDGAGMLGVEHGSLHIVATGIEYASALAAADFDGDGDTDVAACFHNDNQVGWYENLDGSGSFGPPQVLDGQPVWGRSLAAADLDGDGDTDIACASRADHSVGWYTNEDGAGSFGSEQLVTTTATDTHSVFAADLDGDSDLDLLVGSNGAISWFENGNGLGDFAEEHVVSASSPYAREVVASDFDGDGDLDILAGEADGTFLYRNADGLGAFGPAEPIDVGTPYIYRLLASDVDGDGDQDAIAAPVDGDEIIWYRNDGLGSFALGQTLVADGHVPAISAGDLDGDGATDVLSAGGQVSWYANVDGTGAFGPAEAITQIVPSPTQVLAMDVDGDEDQDLVYLSKGEDERIEWRGNLDGAGTFGLGVTISTEVGAVDSLWSADIDGDGRSDLLTCWHNVGPVEWYRNGYPEGAFGEPLPVDTGGGKKTAAIGADLDGDGDTDVLVSGSNLGWVENADGAGTFASEKHSIPLTDAELAIAADIDADGDLDVLSGTGTDDTAMWFRNLDGAGTFGAAEVLPHQFDYAPGPKVIADFNGDGDLDAVIAEDSLELAGLYSFANLDGDGGFSKARLVSTTPGWIQELHAPDLDWDGDVDLVAAELYFGGAVAYENVDGLGTFGSATVVGFEQGSTYDVAVADIDGDGHLDVAFAGFGGVASVVGWSENLFAPLMADVEEVSASIRGGQELQLTAGVDNMLAPYLVLGSFSGTEPGGSFGGASWPLNFDSYSRTTFAEANGPWLVNTMGTLGANGTATSCWKVPPGARVPAVGLTLHHAFGVLDMTIPSSPAVTFVSNPVALHLVP